MLPGPFWFRFFLIIQTWTPTSRLEQGQRLHVVGDDRTPVRMGHVEIAREGFPSGISQSRAFLPGTSPRDVRVIRTRSPDRYSGGSSPPAASSPARHAVKLQ